MAAGDPPEPAPYVVVVMGVSGTGKSTVGMAVAEALEVDFVEGDAHHPDANITKMSSGIPLDDDDRRPWLEELARVAGRAVGSGRSAVLTCSALKRAYRDLLRAEVPDGRMFFVHLDAPVAVLAERMGRRTKHFMPTSLLDSQVAVLEPLAADEPGAVVDVTASPSDVASAALAAITDALGS